jgi:hypothetical protein
MKISFKQKLLLLMLVGCGCNLFARAHDLPIPRNDCDSIPSKAGKKHTFKSSTYNKTTKQVTVRYWDGSSEVMTMEAARKKNLWRPPPKVNLVKFTPPKKDE